MSDESQAQQPDEREVSVTLVWFDPDDKLRQTTFLCQNRADAIRHIGITFDRGAWVTPFMVVPARRIVGAFSYDLGIWTSSEKEGAWLRLDVTWKGDAIEMVDPDEAFAGLESWWDHCWHYSANDKALVSRLTGQKIPCGKGWSEQGGEKDEQEHET